MDQEELNLKADFARYHVFIKVFAGSIDKWKDYLRKRGSMDQVTDDYQFILWLEKELRKDPGLLNRIRKMVNESDLEINKGDKSMNKAEDSKEFKAIMEAIEKWISLHNNNVCFACAFLTHDKEEDLKAYKDNRVMIYGRRSGIEKQIEDIKDVLKEELDGTFINV